jgi:hypothetical protein
MGVARLLSNLRVLDVLLVDLSLVVVAGLLDLVAEGVLGGGDTDICISRVLKAMDMVRSQSYRVPMGACPSLATSLLTSLLAPEVAPWTVSET